MQVIQQENKHCVPLALALSLKKPIILKFEENNRDYS